MQCQLSKFPSPASSFPPHHRHCPGPLLSCAGEGGMETLCFEGVKLTCRMEAAREERNRKNQPPSPSKNTHTLRRNGLAFAPAGTSRSAHYGSTCGVLRVPTHPPTCTEASEAGRCPELLGRAFRATSAGSAPARSLPSTAHPAVET